VFLKNRQINNCYKSVFQLTYRIQYDTIRKYKVQLSHVDNITDHITEKQIRKFETRAKERDRA